MAAAALVALSCALPARGQSPEVVRKVLDNGLRLIVKPEKGSGLVAVVAAIGAGASQEGIQNAGIGNFVANLVLASTRLSSAEDVAAIADEVGGNIGSQWHPDFTEIRAITTSDRFNQAMSLIGECLTEANFEHKWVEQVRAELLRKLKTGSDDVFERAYTNLRELLYEDNGYRRPPPGFERTIRNATAEDLRKFYSTYYVPNNVVISVVGDVTVEQALDRAQKAFAGVPSAKLPKDRGMPDEELERSKFRASEADLSAAYLMLGWLAPALGSRDYAAVAVATNALGGGKGSIMFRELRQKRGMGYDLGARYPRSRYQSHVLAYIITDPFKSSPGASVSMVLEEVKAALIEQVENLKRNPLSPEDLERAKGYTIGSYSLEHQRMLDRCFYLAWLEIIGVGIEFDRTFADQVSRVTAEDVQRVCRTYFTNYAAVLLLPRTKSPPTEGSGKG